MTKIRGCIAAAMTLIVLAPAAFADLAEYNQDFEGLVQADPQALENDGWLTFVNVFSGVNGGYLYGYGNGRRQRSPHGHLPGRRRDP